MIAEIALKGPAPEKPHRPDMDVEKAGASGLRLEAIAGANFIMETVKLINETSVSELESKLPEFVQKRNQNAFVLGGVLEKIRRERFWNPGSRRAQNALFEHWVEETCHYSGRKARYLISVYVGLVQAAIPSTKVLEIGWSKLRVIAPFLRPISGENVETMSESKAFNEQLLRMARRKPRKALEAALRSLAPDVKSVPADDTMSHTARRFIFNVKDDDAGLVAAALEKIERTTGHTGAAALVDMASAIDAEGDMSNLEYAMKKAGKEASHRTYVRLFGEPGKL